MIDRPDEPGIRTREGKFYRVWIAGREDSELVAMELGDDGREVQFYRVIHLPPGDWHNLTAPATNAEARDKFHGWLKGHCNQSSDEQIADKAAEIFAGVPDQIAGLKGIIARQDEEITSIRLANIAEREQPPEPGVIDQLYRHAIDRVDRVFQECTENPKPILPDFLRLGEDKFDGVVKLAEAYRDGSAEITTLKATVAKLEEQVAAEHAKYINSERAATVALQAQTILKQAEKIAELKRERNNFANAADHLSADANRFQGSLQKLRDIAMSHGWDEGWTHGDLGAWLDQQLSEVPQQPEVIEGKGQAVTEEWCESIGGLPGDEVPIEMAFTLWEKGESERDGHDKSPHMHLVWSSIDSALFLETYDQHGKTLAAIELPVEAMQENVLAILKALGQKIEPRPAFVAPPKPEQVLIRYGGMTCWAIRDGDWYRRIGITGGMSSGLCELIDEKTGEPIKEQA